MKKKVINIEGACISLSHANNGKGVLCVEDNTKVVNIYFNRDEVVFYTDVFWEFFDEEQEALEKLCRDIQRQRI